VKTTASQPGITRSAARARLAIPALAALLAAVTIFCAGRKEEAQATPSPTPDAGLVVATVGGTPLPYRAFERYLSDNAGDDTGEGEQENIIKSRLLDQFLEEQLLLRAADGMKIAVSDSEIDSYLSQIGVTEGEADVSGGEGKEAFRDKVRQGMILQKVKDQAVLSKVQVTPAEVQDELKKQPDLLKPSRMVALRQILVDDRSVAERLHAALVVDPSKFEALARESSVAPDRGQARTYSEEELPVEIREPVFALEPGQVSGVIELAQRYLIFQLVRKIERSDVDQDEVRHRIQMALFQRKGEQALDRYIDDLKKETEIRVNRTILPFDYVGEYKN
jgi:parvulin-like peptidyl-prolyl isomerase